jgi:hypothetical protein
MTRKSRANSLEKRCEDLKLLRCLIRPSLRHEKHIECLLIGFFFPLKKEHLSTLRRSWEDGNCRDGDSCGWARPTTISAVRLGAHGSSGRHSLRSLLPCGFGLGDRTTSSLVSFGLGDGIRDDLAACAFISGKLTLGIDLTFADVENAWACSDGLKLRVAARAKRWLRSRVI